MNIERPAQSFSSANGVLADIGFTRNRLIILALYWQIAAYPLHEPRVITTNTQGIEDENGDQLLCAPPPNVETQKRDLIFHRQQYEKRRNNEV